jgi:5-methylcytosine-specific restriction protein A
MIEKLKFILDNYLELKKDKKTDHHILFKTLCIDAKDELEKYLENEERYIVKGSVGVGVWSEIPWLAIFDRFVTTTAQKGYYPVFLFRNDMSGFYLSLGIGVTSFQLEFKESKKIKEALRLEYQRLYNKIKIIPNGFKSTKDIDYKLKMNSIQNRLYNIGVKKFQYLELKLD